MNNMKAGCYGSPIATLPPLARATLTVLNEARGFFRTRGMTIEEVFDRLRNRQRLSIRFTNSRRVRLNEALLLLAEKDKARQLETGKWRAWK